MSVTELKGSRRERMTINGRSIEFFYKTTWGEGDDGTAFTTLPKVGEELSAYDDMRCTELFADNMPGAADSSSDPCKVTVVYSTNSSEMPIRKDQAASWTETLSSSVEAHSLSQFTDTDDTRQYWPKLWEGGGVTGATVDNAPPVIDYYPRITYTTTVYSSEVIAARCINAVGSVNSADFIRTFSATKKKALDQYNDDFDDLDAEDDTGKWLFTSAVGTRLRATMYQYDLTFEYDKDGWNTPHGVNSSIKLYPTGNFNDLFEGFDRIDPYTVTGLHA
ncbi:MAG: hypothetical protein GY841_08700 [FCB group bacterium]|nr:hypothetical protein [FCB group bacterium]